MARVTDQDIPPEYQDAYDRILESGEWIPGIGRVRERLPFRIRALQGCRTIRPWIYRGSKVSDAMCDHRYVFGDCLKCFNRQPWSGGAEPDGIGGYSRTWWFDEAVGILPWYFNYFMYVTLPMYVAGGIPDWCKEVSTFSAWGDIYGTGEKRCNHSDWPLRNVAEGETVAWTGSPIEKPAYLIFLVYGFVWDNGADWPIEIKAWEVPDTWGCYGKPDGSDPRAGRYLGNHIFESHVGGLIVIEVKEAMRVCLTNEKFGSKVQIRGGDGGLPWNGPWFG